MALHHPLPSILPPLSPFLRSPGGLSVPAAAPASKALVDDLDALLGGVPAAPPAPAAAGVAAAAPAPPAVSDDLLNLLGVGPAAAAPVVAAPAAAAAAVVRKFGKLGKRKGCLGWACGAEGWGLSVHAQRAATAPGNGLPERSQRSMA